MKQIKNFKWFVYRYGRVNYVLAKRLDLLTEVQRLQESLEVTGDVAYTCETAGHFFLYQVLARWEIFLATVRPANKKVCFSLKKFYNSVNDFLNIIIIIINVINNILIVCI